jgi:hypothetical protein
MHRHTATTIDIVPCGIYSPPWYIPAASDESFGFVLFSQTAHHSVL